MAAVNPGEPILLSALLEMRKRVADLRALVERIERGVAALTQGK